MVTRRVVRPLYVVLGLVGFAVAGPPAPALGVPLAGHGHGRGRVGGGSGGRTRPRTSLEGRDVSYPQCGTTLPAAPAFGIVGVNGGVPNGRNPCLGPSSAFPSYAQSELYWAEAASTGAVGGLQPDVSVYLNTADPGNVDGATVIGDWPTSGSTPFGACAAVPVAVHRTVVTVGASSPACAWEYGYAKASQDVKWVSSAGLGIDTQAPLVTVPGAVASFAWWLDVETGNTWQPGPAGSAMNVAVLQGMVAALRTAGATAVGVYSTASQWAQVTGTATASSGPLVGLPDWVPGAASLAGAVANCGLPSFTGGKVVLTQWTGTAGITGTAGTTDADHHCGPAPSGTAPVVP